MSLKPGTKLGPYEVLAMLGAGGMGEVYKALDTRLDRTVALKTLRAHLADQPEVKERFEREARTVASLQHDHICVLFDIRKDDGIDYLVLEYLEGDTLATRLLKGPLPLAQVLQYSVEIADALDKAHRKGVTHRDIKPGNIMLVKSGSSFSTKLLDFGLAKLKQVAPVEIPLGPEDPTPPLGVKPLPPTVVGTIMGTFQYMSPEQAEGQNDDIDARTDIFSFGAVIYEMVTGKKAFEGKTQASLIGAILHVEPPPMSSLQPVTPSALDRVVKQCLAKEPDERWQTASDLCRELQWIKDGGGQIALTKSADKGWRRVLVFGLATFLIAGMTGLAVWKLKPTPLPNAQRPAHVSIALPPGDRLAAADSPPVALSPDGNHLVYVAIHDDVQQLFVRAMDSGEAKPLPGTEGSASPFFSPDGEWIGFFAGGKLKKVSIAGGAALTLCDAGANGGASWGTDDTIVFTPSVSSGLWRVSAAGGTPRVLTTLDHAQGEISHRWPQFLPGGKALLFAVLTGLGWDEMHTAILNLDTGKRRVVLRGGHTGRFVPTGHLVYYRTGTLMAVPFDLARLEVTSNAPVVIAEGVTQSNTVGAEYSFSAAGSLAYVPASLHKLERRLVWVDRKGEIEPLPAPPRSFGGAAISPDGQRVAVSISSGTVELWIYDLARGALTRLTTEGDSQNPIWTPDGKRITYRGTRAGFRNVFWRAADGSGSEERLATGDDLQVPSSWSPDGKWLAFTDASPATGNDIWMLRMEGARKPQPFLRTPFGEGNPTFSPDGHWLAYQSDESGRNEVYVQSFLDPSALTSGRQAGPGGKWQISTDGGNVPRWARNGRELFYRYGNKMMVVDIRTEPTFTAGKPRLLFEGQFAGGGDVSPDGQRFLMFRSVEPEQPATQINFVLNWFDELKKKALTGK